MSIDPLKNLSSNPLPLTGNFRESPYKYEGKEGLKKAIEEHKEKVFDQEISYYGRTLKPFDAACYFNMPDQINDLLKLGAGEQRILLMHIYLKNIPQIDCKTLENILELVKDIHERDEKGPRGEKGGNTCLHLLAKKYSMDPNFKEALELLLKKGADPKALNGNYDTPNEVYLESLLEKGIKNKDNIFNEVVNEFAKYTTPAPYYTPCTSVGKAPFFRTTIKLNDIEKLKRILAVEKNNFYNPYLEFEYTPPKGIRNYSALELATLEGDLEIVKRLFKMKSETASNEDRDRTEMLLHCSIMNKNVTKELFEFALEHTKDINAAHNFPYTPLQCAVTYLDFDQDLSWEIVEKLLEKGSNPFMIVKHVLATGENILPLNILEKRNRKDWCEKFKHLIEKKDNIHVGLAQLKVLAEQLCVTMEFSNSTQQDARQSFSKINAELSKDDRSNEYESGRNLRTDLKKNSQNWYEILQQMYSLWQKSDIKSFKECFSKDQYQFVENFPNAYPELFNMLNAKK